MSDEEMTGYRVDGQRVDSMELDGEAVLLNLVSHSYFGLNSTGTNVWQLVKAHSGISMTEISVALSAHYQQDAAAIAAGVAAWLDEMVRQNLLTKCPPQPVDAVRIERRAPAYAAPTLEVYGDLDTLILSGE